MTSSGNQTTVLLILSQMPYPPSHNSCSKGLAIKNIFYFTYELLVRGTLACSLGKFTMFSSHTKQTMLSHIICHELGDIDICFAQQINICFTQQINLCLRSKLGLLYVVHSTY